MTQIVSDSLFVSIFNLIQKKRKDKKIANRKVKDKLLLALITIMAKEDWSKIIIAELINFSELLELYNYRSFKFLKELM